jgi:hypothetical protein
MSSSVNRALSLLPLTVLNASLVARGFPVEPLKANAILTVESLINQGLITLDEVRASAPNNVSRVATSGSTIPDDIRAQVVSASADVLRAVGDVQALRDTTNRLLDQTLAERTENDKRVAELTARLNSQVQAVQGVDYGKVESTIRSEVSKLFATFKKETPKAELTTVANALPVFERKQVKDVFDGQLQYEHQGEIISFADYWIEVWGDPLAPARVDDYIFNPRHLHQALVALDNPLPDNVWLAGERGTGKSEFVAQIASRLGRRLFRVNFDEALERAEFIGGNTIENGNVVWKAGVITQAIQHTGAIVLLDEIGFARAQNLAVLHALCEHSKHRAIVIPETGVRIPVASHVAFFCADNSNGHGDASGNFAGVRDQNTAFIDRFSYTLQFEYLPHDDEVKLICNRTGLPYDASNVLVTFANTAREKARAGLLTQPPSLRQLFAWARAIQKGVPVSVSFDSAIVNKFPVDCESELRGIFSATIDTAQLKSYLTK